MSKISLEEAQSQLLQLIERLQPGEEVLITLGNETVAMLVGGPKPKRPPRKLGTLQGTVTYMAPDFDAPLEDFREYMG